MRAEVPHRTCTTLGGRKVSVVRTAHPSPRADWLRKRSLQGGGLLALVGVALMLSIVFAGAGIVALVLSATLTLTGIVASWVVQLFAR